MDYNNLEYYYFFLREIENKYGHPIVYYKDCTVLSESVKYVTGQHISPLTLSRIFLFNKQGIKPRLFTIDTLAIYIGFFDYHHFLRVLADDLFAEHRENPIGFNSYTNIIAFWDKHLICRFINGFFADYFEQGTDEVISKNIFQEIKKSNFSLNENSALNDLTNLPFSFNRNLPLPNGHLSSTNFTLSKLGSGRGRGVLVLQITEPVFHQDWEKDILKFQFNVYTGSTTTASADH